MKKRLLIVNKKQFGYHTDTYKYTQYLNGEFDITYICFDDNQVKKDAGETEIKYISKKGSFLVRGFRLMQAVIKFVNSNKVDLIFIKYFQMSSFLKVRFPNKLFIFDIRTGSMGDTWIKRKRYDYIMILESLVFKNVTIISECLRERLKIKGRKCHILPLGSDTISTKEKKFENLNLIYVGTFNKRNIHETIIGLKLFVQKQNQLDVTYDIFGSGSSKNELILKNTIKEENLEGIVKLHGRKNHDELKPFFDNCNVGVSYIPIKDYYDCQPPTKTFEYINSGMICVGTSTIENKRIINKNNGVLCEDNAKSFSLALETYVQRRKTYDNKIIRTTLSNNNWKTISQNLAIYLNSKLEEKGSN